MISHGTTGAKMVSVEGRITRADGTVIELGTLAYWHANPLRRLAWRIKQLFGSRRSVQ